MKLSIVVLSQMFCLVSSKTQEEIHSSCVNELINVPSSVTVKGMYFGSSCSLSISKFENFNVWTSL